MSDDMARQEDRQIEPARRVAGQWRRLALLVVALGVVLALYWPAQAAMELMYYRAESTDSAVVLNWATAREIDVEGYIILCKRQEEPESAYHFIGQRAATGGPDQPAEYSFAVTEDVYFGEQYCFRLEEVTTNDEPGEKRDICGYGPGVTPTPAVGGLPVGAAGTLTPIVVTPFAGQSPAPTLITPSPTPTWTPVGFGQSPIATPGQPVSPLGTPFPTPTTFVGGSSLTATPTWTLPPTAPPIATETATATPTPTQPQSPQAAVTAAPIGAGAGASDATSPDVVRTAGDGPVAPTATATQMYVVVTATPTEAAIAAAPTLTPLPTVTSAPDLGLLNVLSPSAQNMMVMMLCLIFLSATGLGTLGLVTTILYFRSQAQRRTDGNDYVGRRRF